MNLADGFDLVVRTAIAAARPDPDLHVDQWAERYMVLPKSGPTKGGAYRFERTPYARRVHQVLSPIHPAKRVVARVASQMFKTQTAINWICACIHQAPGNILALEPTDGLAKRLSARLSMAIRNTPEVRACVSAERSRDKRNTTQAKDFKGDATLYINTAGAAANLAEITARYIYVDEIDRLDRSVDGEGDPVELAEARATQHQNDGKFFYTSSPKLRGYSRTDELFEMGTQEVYHVPCPHCAHLHPLELANFKYSRDEETGHMARAWFTCPECGAEIDERHKSAMMADEPMGGRAKWVATAPGDGETISFWMSAFYMPAGAITWLSLARQYDRALDKLERGDPEPMQVFMNTRMGLSFESGQTATTAQELQKRAEDYAPRTIPEPALVVTAAVDTQANRLEVQIEAWGPGMEHWVLDYITLIGDPSEPPSKPGSVWARLDEIRRTPFPHASGVMIPISAYGIDSGGANTQDVYNYGAARRHLSCTVLKGSNRPNRPIISSAPSKVDVNWQGRRIEGGAALWFVGTDVAKDYLHNRFAMHEGPGAMHFHRHLGEQWFEQLLAERRHISYHKGRVKVEWIKANGDRNEALDASVYNLAIAYQLGLHKWSAQDWAALRKRLIPKQITPDLFAPAPPPAQTLPDLSQATEPEPVAATVKESSTVAAAATPAPAPVSQPTPPLQHRRRTYSKGIA